jgi:hypothetical protein
MYCLQNTVELTAKRCAIQPTIANTYDSGSACKLVVVTGLVVQSLKQMQDLLHAHAIFRSFQARCSWQKCC